jgi:hypothetical protein
MSYKNAKCLPAADLGVRRIWGKREGFCVNPSIMTVILRRDSNSIGLLEFSIKLPLCVSRKST